MKKQKSHAFGKDVYLLGVDSKGIKYWLEEAKFDCGWYWGGGYIETYTNNNNPSNSKDINSHSHFNSMFDRSNANMYDAFKEFFIDTPFNDSEIWKICELMKSFYIAREYSDMLHIGGANYTTNPMAETIKSKEEYARINDIVIPKIMAEVYNILGNNKE